MLKFENDQVYVIGIFLTLSIINEFSGVMGKIVGKVRRYDGPMGKSDRAFVISIYGVLSYFGPSIILAYADYLFIIVVGLLVVSTITRLKKAIA